jgi:hypothetical protein
MQSGGLFDDSGIDGQQSTAAKEAICSLVSTF